MTVNPAAGGSVSSPGMPPCECSAEPRVELGNTHFWWNSAALLDGLSRTALDCACSVVGFFHLVLPVAAAVEIAPG